MSPAKTEFGVVFESFLIIDADEICKPEDISVDLSEGNCGMEQKTISSCLKKLSMCFEM